MSSYWKKKLDELNEQNAKKSSSKTTKTTKATKNNDYWGQKLTELENAKKEKDEADIGPVRIPTSTTKKKDKDEGFDFFQKGGFEDGYQFGDVTKTILGTTLDAGIGVVKGASKLVGGVIDAGTYGVAGIADAMGNDDFADRLRVKARENVIDKEFEATDKALDEYSLLGRTTDSIAEGLGQVGAIILTGGIAGAAGAGAIGATAATTGVMGVSSFGSGMSEAYQGGATDEEAATYGLVKGVVDAGSELLFGGLGKAVKAVGLSKGLTSLDDVLAQKISSKVTNQVAKNFVEYGVKASAEGVEEVIAGIGSAMGKQATYMSDKELSELLADEELLEQFVVGAVTSGIAQSGLVPGMRGGSLAESNATGRDFISGLSENEQKVIDKEYQNRINEQEQDGRKLTKQEKSKIYDAVVSDMDKGYISTDTIEEVLGGDTYKTYRDTIDSEDELLREFEELGKKQNATLAEQSRYAELKEQVKEIQGNSQRGQLQSRLREEVMGLVQNDRLSESYNERTRRGQAFEADLTRYDPKQQSVIQKAVESGILNNTNRTHEFVDMIAKISADKGVLFDFANNERLKESGFAVNGKTVNGYVTKDGVTLNIDSAKSLNSVVGHEITHVLEGTDLYTALQSAVVEYAKTKGEYQGRYDSLAELYKNIEGANVDAELTADLVGDYLFTDSDFIHNLSTNHRNVFQKIYDEIKYLCKVATAGSKEARELEKVKRAFEKAYQSESKSQENAKYSLGYHAGDLGKSESYAMQGKGRSTGHFGFGTYFVGDEAKISGDNTYGNRPHHAVEFDNYNLYKIRNDKDGYELHEQLKVLDGGVSQEFLDAAKDSKFRVSELRNEAYERSDKYDDGDYIGAVVRAFHEVAEENGLEVSTYDEWLVEQDPNDYPKPGDSDYDFYRSDYLDYLKETVNTADSKRNSGYEDFNDAYFKLWLRFGKDNVNRALQSVVEHNAAMENSDYDTQRQSDSLATVFMKSLGYEGIDVRGTGLDDTTYGSVIYDLKGEDAKRKAEIGTAKYSLSDSDGKQLSAEQQEYFKDSKVRDENGNLKVMYHGTPNGDFTVFKDGTYFTENKEYADRYQSPSASSISSGKTASAPKTFEVYLDIKKPFDITDAEAREIYINEYIKGGNAMGINPYLSDAEYDKITTIDWTEGEDLRDFLIENDYAYDGLVLDEGADGGYGDEVSYRGKSYVVFSPEQVKNIDNTNPTGDKDIRYSVSGNDRKTFGNYNVYGKDVALAPTAEDSSTVAENATVSETESVAPVVDAKNATTTPDVQMFPDDAAPMREPIPGQLDSLTDEDAPPEMAAPYYGETEDSGEVTVKDPMIDRDMQEVGSPKVKAYMYENPEVKPFFQAEAAIMLRELQDSTKGQRLYNDQLYYESGGEHGWMGQKRNTSDEIAYLLDGAWNAKGKGYTYAEIEKGLKAIIEDNGKENNACSKRIEFLLNDRLRDGYTDFRDGSEIPPDEGYLALLEEKQITEYSKEAFDALVEHGEEYAPPAMYDIGPDNDSAPPSEPLLPNENEVGGTTRQNAKGQQKLFPDPEPSKPDVQQQMWPDKTARILPEEPKANKNQRGLWSMFKEYVLDNGMIFEDLSLKTGNRELQAKWHYIRNARAMAQSFMGKGKNGARALNDVRQTVENSGKMQQFSEYAYHLLNVDRMTLAQRYEGMENKPVFGDSVTAEMSARTAARLERANPEFKRWAQELYAINTQLREMLVEGGVLSRETANLWAEMYPHYIPIRRAGYEGAAINVALDTNRTGVNAPIKKATGGNRDILPMFDTMGQRTLQTYRAIAKNRFGLELRKTLGTTISEDTAGLDSVIDSMDNEEGLLTKGEHGKAPTFTVFENGKRYTFEITDEMYESMKPTSDLLAYTNPVANAASNAFRGVLTEYNPVFMMTNAMKDVQDIIMNSQHPARTYMSIPKAILEMKRNGNYYREYMENGGEENTYFDGMENSFDTEEKGAKKLLGVWPLSWISKWNNRIERLPRMAEYIASREDGRSVEVSMLDAARVTTNFAAGGKLTKFANRNGATFLNASVQGAVQQARNIREAKANGLKGAIHLAAKVAIAGLPVMIFNHLMWDDDEEYEELSDYVKQNYYIVGKYGDGKFVRIPKGRTLAVIQNAFEQMKNLATGDDEADLKSFLELAIANLAPNNPVEDNIIAPIMQVKNNETWYGEDLVPTRLQDLPKAEQYDESTDAISKWLGEKQPFLSPYQINYLLNQYSGGVGDVVLPFLTPEAERGENSLFAPLADKFTTDSVMNNQNVSDFYDTKDELTVNANASNAKDEDILKSKYMNAINSELSELYKQNREIQNSDKSNAQKYAEVYAVQSQIVELTRQALDAYENIERNGDYAKIGDMYFQWYTPEKGDSYWRKLSDEQTTKYLVTSAAGNANYATDGNVHYRREDDGSWTKISDRQLERQREVTEELGITPEEYWSETDISFMPMSDGEYEYAFDNPANYALAKSVGGYDAYKGYSKDLSAIKADKDKNGKSITGSRKEKVQEYINNLDADYYTKIILWKNEYNSDDTYNREIIEYLNGNDDISGDEMREILIKLGFTVDDNGNISW